MNTSTVQNQLETNSASTPKYRARHLAKVLTSLSSVSSQVQPHCYLHFI